MLAAQNTIRVSYATLSMAYMDHIVAMDKGYLKEEGLNGEVIRAPGGVATPGAFSGTVSFQQFRELANGKTSKNGDVPANTEVLLDISQMPSSDIIYKRGRQFFRGYTYPM